MTIQPIANMAMALAVLGVSTLWAQPSSKLTARELFYTPVAPAKAPAAKKAAPKQQAATKKSPPSRPTQTKPVTKEDVEREVPQVQLASQQDHEMEPGDVRFMTVGATSPVPLGLRYSILKYGGDDEAVEVDPDMVFRSGDRIRLRVQVNDNGFLYVVTQGSSGNWRVLFPSAEQDDGSNRVTRGRSYDIPRRTRFVFDEQPGTEKLFLVLTRTPENDIDQLIYKLENPRETTPAAAPEKSKPVPTMLAMNSLTVSDDLVNRMRGKVIARDLVFEKVNEDKPAPKAQREPEKAVYVANPSREASARLVVDIELKHR